MNNKIILKHLEPYLMAAILSTIIAFPSIPWIDNHKGLFLIVSFALYSVSVGLFGKKGKYMFAVYAGVGFRVFRLGSFDLYEAGAWFGLVSIGIILGCGIFHPEGKEHWQAYTERLIRHKKKFEWEMYRVEPIGIGVALIVHSLFAEKLEFFEAYHVIWFYFLIALMYLVIRWANLYYSLVKYWGKED